MFVSDRKKMGSFAISRPTTIVAWMVAGLILTLNLKLLFDTVTGA
jgi:manganese transport protein